MDLSIIIVSWNTKNKLKENLKEIYNSKTDLSYEVFVVDNNSFDETVDMIKTEFPEVKLIVNDKNLGFAKANNQAIKKATGDFILLLNPDMQVKNDTLDKMVNWMKENVNADVASCKLVNKEGETIKHVRKFPSFFDQAAIVKKVPHIYPGILNRYLQVKFDYSKESVVDSVRGSFFMIRRETIDKIGLLDEDYFIWFEEVDYCKRIKEVEGEVWYTPVCECIDYVGQSFKQVSNIKAQYYFRDSMLTYFKKWHPKYQYYLLKITWPYGIFMTKLLHKSSLKKKNVT